MNHMSLFRKCLLCPRECGADRASGGTQGFCRESAQLRVGYVGPHFGEEPPITGTRGSGTVFFAGCSLRCSFCQNHQISRAGLGEVITGESLLARVEAMILRDGVHNVNLVTPDHFFPHAFDLVSRLRNRGHGLPVAMNLSGYQSIASLRLAHDYTDIYLPDFKYADRNLAAALSQCRNYPDVALSAIGEMIKRKGFLHSFEEENGPAKGGVLVRHLILPGYVTNSLDALTTLFLEFGGALPLSIMSQYHPVLRHEDQNLNSNLREDKFDAVYSHALDLGFENLFIQVSGKSEEGSGRPPFVPDFRLDRPFASPGPRD